MSARWKTPRRLAVAAAAAAAALAAAYGSDQRPAPPQAAPIVLRGGTVHPVAAEARLASIGFERGVITAIAEEVPPPAGGEVIDVTGLHVYPALIALGTQLGLIEIDQARATRDQSEVGELNPNVRAEISVNPDSEHLPVARANGIALAQAQPTGGLISGTSALLRLDGWTYEDLVYEAPLGVHVWWPAMDFDVPGDDEAARKRREERDRKLRELTALFDDARAYQLARSAGAEIDLRCEALVPCVTREMPVFLHAAEELQIRAALDWLEANRMRGVLVGGQDAPRVIDRLVALDVPVIYGPVHALPARIDDAYDAPFTAPRLLHDAGVRFAIADFQTSNCRNLPYQAATAAAYGLPRDEALKAITLYPAQILGVAERVGSLARGKDATLIVTDGDPLEIRTQVKMMFIEGRRIDLTSRHTMLYEKYKERLRRAKSGQGAR
ncbi:MAG: amidohydrolase family protein [Planctomycetes bacterium]|nr:amidohydrolase family protein [Planctomycetota bacterium]